MLLTKKIDQVCHMKKHGAYLFLFFLYGGHLASVEL